MLQILLHSALAAASLVRLPSAVMTVVEKEYFSLTWAILVGDVLTGASVFMILVIVLERCMALLVTDYEKKTFPKAVTLVLTFIVSLDFCV